MSTPVDWLALDGHVSTGVISQHRPGEWLGFGSVCVCVCVCACVRACVLACVCVCVFPTEFAANDCISDQERVTLILLSV